MNYSCEFHTSTTKMKKCVCSTSYSRAASKNVNKNLHNFNSIHHYNIEILHQTSCRVLHLKSTRNKKICEIKLANKHLRKVEQKVTNFSHSTLTSLIIFKSTFVIAWDDKLKLLVIMLCRFAKCGEIFCEAHCPRQIEIIKEVIFSI